MRSLEMRIIWMLRLFDLIWIQSTLLNRQCECYRSKLCASLKERVVSLSQETVRLKQEHTKSEEEWRQADAKCTSLGLENARLKDALERSEKQRALLEQRAISVPPSASSAHSLDGRHGSRPKRHFPPHGVP
jgi:hypothetical protein